MPLHEQVAETLRRKVLNRLHPGVKLESEAHLARRLGVSVLTLRQALSVLAHEGLIDRRHGSGTYVTDRQKHKVVAVGSVTYPGQHPHSFQMRLFVLLSELLMRHGYRCRSYVAPLGFADGWAELVEEIERGRIAGAAFVAMDARSVAIRLAESGVPCVGTGYPYPASVELDYSDLVRKGVGHLLQRGCRRIALMQWLVDTPQEQAAHEAFCSAMRDHGAPIRDEWMRRSVPPETPGAGWEQFREIWAARDEKPDGLLVTDDMLFRDVAMAILDFHLKIPDQLQVVAHANKGSGLTYPFPVSLLEVDLNEWAEAMMHRLIKLMNQEPVSPPVRYVRARLIPAEGKEAGLIAAVASPAGVDLETTK